MSTAISCCKLINRSLLLRIALTTLDGSTSTQNQCSSVPFVMKTHVKARGTFYPMTQNSVRRFSVPDDKVSWAARWDEYEPVDFTFSGIKGQVWADPDVSNPNFRPNWNAKDHGVDRISHTGKYANVDGYPRNPVGRTGICGRGRLGRWGPNHAADPIVTRWKRNQDNATMKHTQSGKQILQFVAIQRKDSLEWAIPGGMIDPGETISATLKREFGEEALNTLEVSAEDKKNISSLVDHFFDQGKEIYKGYVDDPRNTDNAWMETVAVNFHDEDGTSVGQFPLHAGDDAVGVKWSDVDSKMPLYASHAELLEKVAQLHKAHW